MGKILHLAECSKLNNAAPQLLAACELALTRRHDGSCPQSAPRPADPNNRRLACECWISEIKAAIAAAKGD
jgi:hypothetical protein